MILVDDNTKCCGCGVCVNVCPKNAITLKEDKYGFKYPVIDQNSCINCGLCKKKCIFQKNEDMVVKGNKQHVYSVVNKDDFVLKNSTSGGAFGALAKYIFDKGGVVYGCAWDENMYPHHITIISFDELYKVQGSKYVQSNMHQIYKQIKDDLLMDKYVLFSGTPCQCDAVRSYLGKSYDKLYCVELICHGVPNAHYFHEFVELLERKYNGKIIDLRFRDKKLGWGALLKITVIKETGKKKEIYLKPEECYYYYYYFYKGLFFRESCYSCKYACENRKSDFTIGDFWGASKFHKNYDSKKGISVLMTSTEKAEKVINGLKSYLNIEESSLKEVMVENGQVINPSHKDEMYSELLNMYSELGADGFSKWYIKSHRKQVLLGKMKRYVPKKLKKLFSMFKSKKI